VKADVTELERVVDEREPPALHLGGDPLLALVRDRQVPAEVEAMASGIIADWAHLDGHRLERHPGRDRPVAGERPIILVGVCGSEAAASFLHQRLVMIQPDSRDLEQLGCDPRQPLAEDELARRAPLLPKVRDLEERLAVGRALLERAPLPLERERQPGDFGPI
jgi:hypothetical protein